MTCLTFLTRGTICSISLLAVPWFWPGVGVASIVLDARKDQGDPWKSICEWVNNNTPQESVFITPPHLIGFPVYAMRKHVTDFKAIPNIDSQGPLWLERLEDLSGTAPIMERCSGFRQCLPLLERGYLALDPQQILRLSEKYSADYLVTSSNISLPFNKLHSNAGYAVYELRSLTSRGK